MHSRIWMCVILASAAMPTGAASAKLAGKVLDANAFGNVKTYCIDTSNSGAGPGVRVYTSNSSGPINAMGPWDSPQAVAFDVSELIKRESGRKGLLSKLPWKLEVSCSAPEVDAIVRFNFHTTAGILAQPAPTRSAAQTQTEQPLIHPGWRADLQVSGKASSRVIYEAAGVPLGVSLGRTAITQATLNHTLRQAAAYDALAALVSDVKTISKNP